MNPVVSVHGLSKSYGSVQALSGISLDIADGVTALLGPNGAGKTSFLRIIATTLKADEGIVRILGRDLQEPNLPDIRMSIGYMPQEASLYQRFRVREFLDYLALLKGISQPDDRRREVSRAIEAVELGQRASERIRSLSGGMRRRVALAQSLIGQPKLLILDEPTVGLDPEQRLRFRDTISSLGETAAVILSTHQTEDVAALARTVVVLDQGSISYTGSPDSLAKLAKGRVWASRDRAAGAQIAWRTGQGFVRNVGDPPTGAELLHPTIEDGYLLLVGQERIESHE